MLYKNILEMLKIKDGIIYVNGNETTNPELIGLSLIDLLEKHPELKIVKPKINTMKYKTINEIPYDLFLRIKSNPEKNYHLLTDKEEINTKELANNWRKLSIQYDKDFKKLMSEDFPINKFRIEHEYIKNKHNIIDFTIKSLQFTYKHEFKFNQDLIDILESFDIKISVENYSEDLENLKLSNDLKREFVELMPSEIEEFDLIDYYVLFCLSTNKLKSFSTLTVTEAFDLQREVIENLYKIN